VKGVLPFSDRLEAGRLLAEEIQKQPVGSVVLFAIPSGGIPVALAVAEKLNAPMDLIVSRKLPLPFSPETGFGAVTFDGTTFLNEEVVQEAGLKEDEIQKITARVLKKTKEIHRRLAGGLPPYLDPARMALVIDDGLATGYTAIAAALTLEKCGYTRVGIAVPVSPADTLAKVHSFVDDVICPYSVDTPFFAVGSFYMDFHQVSEEELLGYLGDARQKGLYAHAGIRTNL